MFGFLNINKPKGMTSYDVVAVLRRITKIKQIGHTGTLDPFATGVLPVCIGNATRLSEYLHNDKSYIAQIKFGFNTDTYDCDGQITQTFDKKINREDLENILKDFTGEIEQLPPMYSAVKVNGKKLYEYARKGEIVEIKPRKVTIYELKLLDFSYENQTAKIFIDCKSGTYIRSLAFDIAQKLGTGAYLTELTRTKSDIFELENSLNLEGLTKETVEKNLINPSKVLKMPMVEVAEADLKLIRNGMSLEKKSSDGFVGLVYNDELYAVGLAENNIIKMKKVLL
ncbi:tRNA pseudouridine(55) synthase TruB [bacterium]|nr:tRNA pseudouridine(55) synthase TruB [bacterium]